MPLLTPTDLTIAETLANNNPDIKAGIVKTEQAELDKVLRRNQLTLDAAANEVNSLMRYGKENTRLNAARLVFQLNGVLNPDNSPTESTKQAPTVIFNFQDSSVNLQGIFNPARDK